MNTVSFQMYPHIVILTGNHLCNNPRVIKEGITLRNAGYAVTVVGAWFDKELKARDMSLQQRLPFDFRAAIDATNNRQRQLMLRGINKIGSILHRLTSFESRSQLGYAYRALRAAARQPADLYIAHSEAAMAVATNLLNKDRLVGIDMEDWFSEDLPLEARKRRPVRLLRNFEHQLLTTVAYSSCPSRSMSDALVKEFGCPPPTVVYNAFPWADRESTDGLTKDRGDRRIPSIHWFSQTLGHGRGLEDLVDALPLLKHEAEVHLRGNPVHGFENWLARRVPQAWRGRIKVHGPVPNAELLSRISEHDIGFAGETSTIRSRDLTITNKILYYLLGGLAVVASDTTGQREVAAHANGAVFLYSSGSASALAARLDALLESTEVLTRAKARALDAAKQTFCWERQEPFLLESIRRALGSMTM